MTQEITEICPLLEKVLSDLRDSGFGNCNCCQKLFTSKKSEEITKKYELTKYERVISGKKLFRIRANFSFGNVRSGDLGGYIEKEENLSHSGECWVYDEACVYENAHVYENAQVSEKAHVFGNSRVFGYSHVSGNSQVSEYAYVCENAYVDFDSQVSGCAWVGGNSIVCGNAQLDGYAKVDNNACVMGSSYVTDNAAVCGRACVSGNAVVRGNVIIHGSTGLSGDAYVFCEDNYTTVQDFGSLFPSYTFFWTPEGKIGVECGLFSGTLNEFRDMVKESYGDSKNAKEYLMLADLMEYKFSEVN